MGWFQVIVLIRKVGVDLILPLVQEIHDRNEEAAKKRLDQALTAQGAGRAANASSRNVGKSKQ